MIGWMLACAQGPEERAPPEGEDAGLDQPDVSDPDLTSHGAVPDPRDQDGDHYDWHVDCDDENPDVHPNAVDYCGEEDRDCDPDACDPVAFAYTLDVDIEPYSYTQQLLGPDFDGDGTQDLVVAQDGWTYSPGSAYSDACYSAGLYVVPGGTVTDAPVQIEDVATANVIRYGCFGASLDTFPDVDGDGIGEILTYTPGLCHEYGCDEDEAFVVGSLDVLAGGTTPDVTTAIYPGGSPTRVGDLDGDEVDDLLLRSGSSLMQFSGATLPVGNVRTDWDTDGVTLGGNDQYVGVVRTGDLDGDGLAEVTYKYIDLGSGAPDVVRISSSIAAEDVWLEVSGEVEGYTGWFQGFDVDGDGYNDLVSLEDYIPDVREHGALYVLPVHDRTGAASFAESATILGPTDTQPWLRDVAFDEDTMTLSTYDPDLEDLVVYQLDPGSLGTGVVDFDTSADCVHTGWDYSHYYIDAGNWLGNGSPQVAVSYENTGGLLLDTAWAAPCR